MAIGARGVSVLFASGDQGVYGRTGPGLFKEKPFHPVRTLLDTPPTCLPWSEEA
jgi:hypothetical protein